MMTKFDQSDNKFKNNNSGNGSHSHHYSIGRGKSKPKKVINLALTPVSTFEQHKELVTESWRKSGLNENWLQSKSFKFVSDTAIDPNGDSVFPIAEFLNPDKNLVRFGRKARGSKSALLMFNEDGSAYQAIVNSPHKDKPYQYLAPKGAGNRAFLPHIPRAIRRAIAERYGITDPEFLNTDKSFWDLIEAHPEIPIIITEGVKKALSLNLLPPP